MDGQSHLLPEAAAHYRGADEGGRLERPWSQLERVRTQELVRRFLPAPPATVADVGGATGVYAFWLAGLGYRVHLIDALAEHIETARRASRTGPPLASIELGDARRLDLPDGSVDAVLLLGPLYHLTEHHERIAALAEAWRVIRPGGVLLAAAITRFASLLDGLTFGRLVDPVFRAIVAEDLRSGQHRNPTGHPDYFTTAFFHHPDELRDEVNAAGFAFGGLFAVEGVRQVIPDFAAWWEQPERREQLLSAIRAVEAEPSLLGVSPHLLAIGRKGRA
ncbi:MAG: class I SAM-dependent methyltransferase [Dehalococcoidia bacterium]